MGQSQCCNSETEDPEKFDTVQQASIYDAPVEYKADANDFGNEATGVEQTEDEQKNDEEALDEEDPASFSKAEDNIGDHICPVTGEESVNTFVKMGLLKRLLEESQEDLGKNFSLDKESLADTKSGAGGIAMAVSDPDGEDCPLVFVSNGFEDLTGYTTDSVVGRSCRFLQPTSKIVNDAMNLHERKLMRAFCTEDQPMGETIVNLLLNERNTGERFWNLLRMQYVSVDGRRYIFGVQTTLDAFMPKALEKRCNIPAKNQSIVTEVAEFKHSLENLRTEIRKRSFAPMLELKGYYSCAVNQLGQLPTIARQISMAKTESRKVSKSNADDVQPGCTLAVNQIIKYSSYQVPANIEGHVVSIDGFGNATVEWKDIGKKILLKRDFNKVQVTATEVENQLKHANAKCHQNWARLNEMLDFPAGEDEHPSGDGIAANYSRAARDEIAQKLINNHKFVIADVTNPSAKLNVEAKALTQPDIRRVDVGSREYVDQMLREVARLLLGGRASFLEEKPDPTNILQVIAWRGCATYLAARTQSKPEQKPGRQPDMSEDAAAAFLAVLDEVACKAEAHPFWKKLEGAGNKKASGRTQAVGVAAAHTLQAREEAARKLIRNHKAVAADVANSSTKLNIEGKPLTQTDLKRVDSNSRAYVDQMFREVARRLLSHHSEMKTEQKFDTANAVQVKAYRGCATYLAARTQSKPEQMPGRKPDMSEPAAAAFLAVLDEVASHAEADLMWLDLDVAVNKNSIQGKAIGIASNHSQQARIEAARKLILNHKFVVADVTNPSPKLNIEGKALTQTNLKRLDISSKFHVDQMLLEVTRRLVGDIQFDKIIPANAEQVMAWRGCATYLAQRTQSKPEQMPGRTPDMSEPAAEAFLAVMEEVAGEAEQSKAS